MTIELLIRSLQMECSFRAMYASAICTMIRMAILTCDNAGDHQSALVLATLLHEINGLADQHIGDLSMCEVMRTEKGGMVWLN